MSRRAKHSVANHRAAAEGLREMPGLELLVGTYRSAQTAQSVAGQIRTASHTLRAYSPAGAFEARTEPVGDETGLYVRYTGQPAEAVAS